MAYIYIEENQTVYTYRKNVRVRTVIEVSQATYSYRRIPDYVQ